MDEFLYPSLSPEVLPQPSFGDKLFLFLKNNPKEFDVTFVVGPKRERIKALKIALKATCPAMERLFRDSAEWDYGSSPALKEGIPLPDMDAQAFRIFLRLLVADSWSFEEVEAMKLSAQVLLNLIAISGRFEMLEMKTHLESLTQSFFVDFPSFVQTEEFLKLSKRNLEAILSSDEIPVDEVSVFDAACQWCEYQCTQQGLDATGENIRNILGDTLFLIRFPAMSNTEFGKVIGSRKILSAEEQLEIFKYISLSEKENPDGMRLPFCTRRRRRSMLNSYSLVSFIAEYPVVDEPAFICDGIEFRNYFQVNKKIAIHSIGFLGPVDSDSFYDITVEVFKHSSSAIESFGRAEGRVFAKQREIFHIMFDTPVVLEATYVQEGLYKKFGYYRLEYFLKGPNTQSTQVQLCKNFKLEADGIGFFCRWDSEQLAELRFSAC